MDNLREQIYLAALLHDIGKFYQRADSGSVNSSKLLTPEVKKLEGVFCPNRDGKYTHKHVLWSAAFLDKFSPVFKNLTNADESGFNTLMEMTAGHHLKAEQLTNKPGRFIQQADHLSAGMDRSSDTALLDDQQEQNWDAFKKTRMASIFEGLNKEQGHLHKYHLPVMPLNIRDDWFAKSSFDGTPDYSQLWKAFEDEFKFIQARSFKAFSETLLNLLQKYTSSIPSSTVNFPDVSLFDHLKTTASLAVCLYDKSLEKDGEADEFMMIGGDFSGIQSYIYNILSKHAAKNLKGRSFYIKLLSDSIVSLLLKRLNLFDANIIYNAGGSFYILAPNTHKTRDAFEKCKAEIEDKIFDAHGTSIYVALDFVTLNNKAFLGQTEKTLSDYWQLLFDKRNAAKSHRYAQRLVNSYETFFSPGESGGETMRDAITGEEISSKSKYRKIADNTHVSDLTWKQINLGKKLREAETWVISDGPLFYWPEAEYINPADLGFCYYFLSKKDVEDKKEQLKGSADSVRIISLNGNKNGDCDFLNSSLQGFNNVFGFDFLGGNDFPKDDNGDPMTFDKLAGDSQNELKRIGILRMDVDNLGKIFRSGLTPDRITFSRYAALSRSLDWFFKGYINTIWKRQFTNSVNIIYSGGDDLFIVGRWDKALEFGKTIQEEFSRYVCHNPSLTLSGGLAIVTGKYPIKKAAADSDLFEKAAKNYYYNDGNHVNEKAAITLLGIPMQWNNEFKAVEDLKNKIVDLVDCGEMPKSYISKIGMHHAVCENYSRNGEKTDRDKFKLVPKEYWMIAYDFSRFKDRLKRNSPALNFIETTKTDIIDNKINGNTLKTDYHSLQLYNLAARWAELELRTDL